MILEITLSNAHVMARIAAIRNIMAGTKMPGKNSRRKFLCLDCKIDTGKIGEHYMLIDGTWSLTGLGSIGMLCVEHVETRIGRQLQPGDFNNSYLNRPRTGIISQRLRDRIGI